MGRDVFPGISIKKEKHGPLRIGVSIRVSVLGSCRVKVGVFD